MTIDHATTSSGRTSVRPGEANAIETPGNDRPVLVRGALSGAGGREGGDGPHDGWTRNYRWRGPDREGREDRAGRPRQRGADPVRLSDADREGRNAWPGGRALGGRSCRRAQSAARPDAARAVV